MLLEQGDIVHLLRITFSGGLIHIWCSSEFLGQQDGVCGIESNKLQCVCVCVCVLMIMKEHVTQCNSVANDALWLRGRKYIRL